MATVREIRAALRKTIEAYTEMEVHVYDTIGQVHNPPAVIVMPTLDKTTADFTEAFNRSDDVWYLDLFVLAGVSDMRAGQLIIDELISGSGPNSIREAIYDHPDLGLPDTQAFVTGVKDYGGRFRDARIEHQGAVIKVTVRTDGRK